MALTSMIDKSLIRQTVATSPILTNSVSQIILSVIPRLTLYGLKERESNPISYELADIYKITVVADIVGSIISAILMKYVGRRIPHCIFSVAGVIAFLMCLFATDVLTVKAGSAFAGLSIGGTNCLGSIMIGEYASPKYRGVFLYLKNAMVLFGVLTMTLISGIASYKTIAMIALAPLIISSAIILMTPESPIWLASKKKYEESDKVFYKLRGMDPESTREIKELIEDLKTRHAAEAREELSLSRIIVKFFCKFITLEFLKPFCIIVFAVLVLEFGGRYFIVGYSRFIANRFTTGDASAFDSELVYILMFVSALISLVLVKVYRQRMVLLSTGFVAIFILVLVLFFSAIIPVRRPAIIVTMLSIYSLFMNLCCTFLPLVLVGELFPLEHKGVGAVATAVVLQVGKYAVSKLSHYILLQELNIRWTLLIYSAVTTVSLLVLRKILPETKDLTLLDIEKNFVNQSNRVRGVELGRIDHSS